jgi:hypothetical protein
MTVLPVRPTPRPSEPLSSYAARLADANGVTRSRVLLPWRHDIDIPEREARLPWRPWPGSTPMPRG